MKKRMIYAFTAMVTLLGLFASCDKDDKDTVTDFDSLPKAAQTTITEHFDKDKVILVTYEKEFRDHEYAVIFADATEIEFDKSGNWESIESQTTGVPTSILPAKIAEFITTTYPADKVTEISKEESGYEVDINDSISLEFDKSGNLTEFES